MRKPFSLLVAAIAAIAACDGGGGSTGTTSGSSGPSQEPAGSEGQEAAYCEAVASHQKCNGGTAAQACEEDGKCIYGRLMSRTAADAYFHCYSSPSCEGDDACAAKAGQAAGGDAADRYTTNCVGKVEGCPDTSDDFCSPAIYAYPNVRDAAEACLRKNCDELEACFRAAVKPISDCK